MSKSLKIILITGSGLLGLLVLVAAALLIFVDADAYKPRLKTAASGALGMEVSVGGRMGISLFPGLLLTPNDVHIRNLGADLVSAKKIRLGIDLLPLLHIEIRIGKIALIQPSISIERDLDGKFSFEKPGATRATLPALSLANISVSDATVLYADKQSGEGFEAGDCKLDVRRLLLSGGKNPDLMKNLSFAAELACKEIRTKDYTVSDFKFPVDEKNGVFDFKPVMMRVFGGQSSGSVRADFSGAVPLYHIRYSLQQFRIEQFYKTLSPDKFVEGPVDFFANLTMQGKTVNEMTRTANGEASLRGEDLTLHGSDLDLEFSRYESSQNFNLVDVGAFIFAGPVGLEVTKGYNFASILKGSGGSSAIRTLASEWKVERGVAQAQDVAMAMATN